jgi:hypothetical protein
MKIVHTLIAAASLAALGAAPAVAQHRGSGGFHGSGGWHGGGGWHGDTRWHRGGYHGGYYGGRGWYAGDAFALGLFSGYAFGGPWAYDYYPHTYVYDYAPPPPPPAYYYEQAPSSEVYDGSDMQPADNGRHCPLYWNEKTGRYEPRCS